ncbi:hypothetical protein BGZ83_007890 [Gryganskiella cystojenkinii]|nr:hypothetical protein BGZ83_007890 [Gryganskiella cystojenkinii]
MKTAPPAVTAARPGSRTSSARRHSIAETTDTDTDSHDYSNRAPSHASSAAASSSSKSKSKSSSKPSLKEQRPYIKPSARTGKSASIPASSSTKASLSSTKSKSKSNTSSSKDQSKARNGNSKKRRASIESDDSDDESEEEAEEDEDEDEQQDEEQQDDEEEEQDASMEMDVDSDKDTRYSKKKTSFKKSKVPSVQELQDELEEVMAAKERLDSKVAQLKERTQYLEADARLKASISAKENMDLKESVRQLEVQLSTMSDGRDHLDQDSLADRAEEALQLSKQLGEAWIQVDTLKNAQAVHVKELAKTREKNAALEKDLTQVQEQFKSTKKELTQVRARWEADKEDLEGEIKSFKARNGGSANEAEWEQDRTKLRNRIQDERASWDQEKKTFLDQIASLKVKAGLQSKPVPSDWAQDKQRLLDQCSTLQLRVATLEGERVSDGSGADSKRLQADNQKLEKKIEALKIKLVEIMSTFKSYQTKAEEEKQRGRPPAPARSRKRAVVNKDPSDSEGEATPILPPPKSRPKRTAATTAVQKIATIVDSDSESDEDRSDKNNDEDDDGEGDDGEEGQANENAMDIDGSELSEPEGDEEQEDEESEADGLSRNKHRHQKRRNLGKSLKPRYLKASDDEFEPSKALMTEEEETATKRKKVQKTPKAAAKPSIKNTTLPEKTTSETSTSKSGSSATVPNTTSEQRSESAKEITTGSTEEKAGLESASGLSTGPDATPTSITAPTQPNSTEKAVKKKRKLLTGKGLVDLGDILNGPGSSLEPEQFMSSLEFNRSRLVTSNGINGGARGSGINIDNSQSKKLEATSLSDGSKPAQARLDALNAIKMQFSIKAKGPSTVRREI